jgi:glycosyltransferase involved in cell wall biosynthesis
MRIFVRVPSNNPSGGIKVANQLVNLIRERGFDSFLVVNGEPYIADWMVTPAPVISVANLMKTCDANDIVIDNWIDRSTVETTRRLNAKIKIYYSQGSTFIKSKDLIGDECLATGKIYTHYWAVSTDSQKILESKYPRTGRWYLVHPYIEHEIISSVREDVKQTENAILCLARKGKSYIFLAKFLFGRDIKFDIVNGKFTEIEAYKLMAKNKFFLSTAVGVTPQLTRNMIRLLTGRELVRIINPYREGFPLPPAEAAMCGSIVIGFAAGGGLEWMSADNCFLAKDRSYFLLIKKIKEALATPQEQLNIMRDNAFKAISKFSKENTWRQITAFLKEEGLE